MGELIKVEAGGRPPAGNKETGGAVPAPRKRLWLTICARQRKTGRSKARRETQPSLINKYHSKQSRNQSHSLLPDREVPWVQPKPTALAPTINTPSGLMTVASTCYSNGCWEFKQSQSGTFFLCFFFLEWQEEAMVCFDWGRKKGMGVCLMTRCLTFWFKFWWYQLCLI